jgi:ParB family chromosome partitioning protein
MTQAAKTETAMARDGKNKRLGRGLAALIGEDVGEDTALKQAREFRRVPIEFLHANPNNPRKNFSSEELDELAASIARKGLLQPILVRPAGTEDNRFEIVAGERRWRAAQKAAQHDVPVVIRDLNDAEALEIAIVENVQRTDLNPIEEAEGYTRLIEGFDYSQKQLAKAIGKSRSHIANTMRLLKLDDELKAYLRDGQLTAGHARALLASDQPDALAENIIKNNLTVRDAERLSAPAGGKGRKTGRKKSKDADTLSLEKNLSDNLGLKVEINDRRGKGGELKIVYRTLEQLDDICTRLLGMR